jgi:hypothetical protein
MCTCSTTPNRCPCSMTALHCDAICRSAPMRRGQAKETRVSDSSLFLACRFGVGSDGSRTTHLDDRRSSWTDNRSTSRTTETIVMVSVVPVEDYCVLLSSVFWFTNIRVLAPFARERCRCQGYFGRGGWLGPRQLLPVSCAELVLRSRPCIESVGGRL